MSDVQTTGRDYFPQARVVEVTRPPADAPSMADIIEVICGVRAAECVCGLPVNHGGANECGRDGGQWLGTLGEDDFTVIRFPDVAMGLR